MTQVSVGSIVLINVGGSRSTGGTPVDIPAVVLSQDPEDGVLTLFAMHFEGQFMQRRDPSSVNVVIDAGKPEDLTDALNIGLIDAALVELRKTVRDDIATLQRQFGEFQEQVLELIAGMKPEEQKIIPDELPEALDNPRPRRR